jgi:hypothetical protein
MVEPQANLGFVVYHGCNGDGLAVKRRQV